MTPPTDYQLIQLLDKGRSLVVTACGSDCKASIIQEQEEQESLDDQTVSSVLQFPSVSFI